MVDRSVELSLTSVCAGSGMDGAAEYRRFFAGVLGELPVLAFVLLRIVGESEFRRRASL